MFSRVFVFLVGTALVYNGVLTAVDIYSATLMVETNVTTDATDILSIFNGTFVLPGNGQGSHTVSLLVELVAECITGGISSCACAPGYVWSNDVCYTHGCCSETTCNKNVSGMNPICVAKVQVDVLIIVALSSGTWDSGKTSLVRGYMQELNGFESLDIIAVREYSLADLKMIVTVKLVTSELLKAVSKVETQLTATVGVTTQGMVNVEHPGMTVCYESSPVLKCTFENATDHASWYMSRDNTKFELNDGSVVTLNRSCGTPEYQSCIAVTLVNVTGVWAGTYECGFKTGSVTHVARIPLHVALLPDEVNIEINPLTADCLDNSEIPVNVSATIVNSTETYEVTWSQSWGNGLSDLSNKTSEDHVVYSATAYVSCRKTPNAQSVSIAFENSAKQLRVWQVDIPVIYAGDPFCNIDEEDGYWPKTPDGNTVINRTCGDGRVGFRSRTCKGRVWQPVYNYCVLEELNNVFNVAVDFEKGLGATQEMAMGVFEGLKNSSTLESDPSEGIADVTASIKVLNVMASASQRFALKEDIYPDFLTAASNLLNNSWQTVNTSTREDMSSNYLHSVEDLVKNVKTNTTQDLSSPYLDLKFCSGDNCTTSVFDIKVNLNTTTKMLKTVGVKNLMGRLKNNHRQSVPLGDILIIATLEDSLDSSLEITMDFPNELQSTNPLCVFWDTTQLDWSDKGCKVKWTDSNSTVCECNHLTSFSVLVSKDYEPNYILDVISTVGLVVSICSLVIYLTIEFFVWSAVSKSNLSHFRHTALINIATFRLLADCTFLASNDPDSLTDEWCLVFTICKHLFYLAMFSWMLCMSVMLVHQIIFVFSPLRKRVFMFLSSIVGYLCPIIIVGFSYTYSKYTYQEYYNRDTCWLVFHKLMEGSLHAFLIPMGTITFTNLFSMVVVILTLVKTSVPEGSKGNERETAKSILKVVLFLTPVFGITWGVGLFMNIIDRNDSLYPVLEYSFVILNSFQGFFILLAGCVTEQKVREEMIKYIKGGGNIDSKTTSDFTSTSFSKSK